MNRDPIDIAPEHGKRVAAVLANTPPLYRTSLSRALSGSASLRAAIKAFCLACTGFERNEVKTSLVEGAEP